MKTSIPWLRIVIEGVVIVVGLGLTGCVSGEISEMDLCDGELLSAFCEPTGGQGPPPASVWATGAVYAGDSLLVGHEGWVEMFYDPAFSKAYDVLVDTATGRYGLEVGDDDACSRTMFAKARYRVAGDSAPPSSSSRPYLHVQTRSA